jgi:hypothetical protein
VRRFEDEIVLCVANLARTVQPVEIPLREFAGLTPVEMLGRTEFPRIAEQPYFLTLAPYGFYWFQLQEVVTPMTARTAPLPKNPFPFRRCSPASSGIQVLDGSMREIIEKHALVPFLERQRWFGGKARGLVRARFADWATLRGGAHPAFLTIVNTEYRDGHREQYLLPLAMSSDREARALEEQHPGALIARITGARKGALYDGLYDDGTCATLLASIQEERTIPMRRGVVQATNIDLTAERAPADTLAPISRLVSDQSNTSVFFGKRLVFKMFRRVEPGPNPDVEIGEFLGQRGFTRVPPLVGSISYSPTPRAGGVHGASSSVFRCDAPEVRLESGQRLAGNDRRNRTLLRPCHRDAGAGGRRCERGACVGIWPHQRSARIGCGSDPRVPRGGRHPWPPHGRDARGTCRQQRSGICAGTDRRRRLERRHRRHASAGANPPHAARNRAPPSGRPYPAAGT